MRFLSRKDVAANSVLASAARGQKLMELGDNLQKIKLSKE
jgi:hypothetical protein